MRGKVAKQLNKLAKLLQLSNKERRKLKQDYRLTKNRSLEDLKIRIATVQASDNKRK